MADIECRPQDLIACMAGVRFHEVIRVLAAIKVICDYTGKDETELLALGVLRATTPTPQESRRLVSTLEDLTRWADEHQLSPVLRALKDGGRISELERRLS